MSITFNIPLKNAKRRGKEGSARAPRRRPAALRVLGQVRGKEERRQARARGLQFREA